MDMIVNLLNQAGNFLRPHDTEVAAAIVATVLVIFGDQINSLVRVVVKPYGFVMRVSAFVALCAFGYGALAFYITPWVSKGLASVATLWYLPVLLVVFILLGLLAERSQQK